MADLKIKMSKMSQVSAKMGERGDCSVRALSIACDVTYERAHDALKMQGRKDRGGVRATQIFAAARLLGKRVKSVSPSVWRGSKLNALVRSSVHTLQNGSYIAFTSGHVLPVVDGVAYDWTATRNNRIKEVYKIVDA